MIEHNATSEQIASDFYLLDFNFSIKYEESPQVLNTVANLYNKNII